LDGRTKSEKVTQSNGLPRSCEKRRHSAVLPEPTGPIRPVKPGVVRVEHGVVGVLVLPFEDDVGVRLEVGDFLRIQECGVVHGNLSQW